MKKLFALTLLAIIFSQSSTLAGCNKDFDWSLREKSNGLVAIEVYHSAHDSRRQNHYAKLAKQYGLATCGGSDYHGDSHHRAKFFGKVGLPREEFIRMLGRLMLAHSKIHKNTEG